ncbi:hypothetical protein BS47DRAFT_1396951 [Hydnum rufescens UP504]|uniref:Uncharacterized protein n=1 Tax=Hydnum rufescens UP504 TaxID=1448309 RepID=A0A9P6AP08_9AGAM|nr:hypothetical protein BS47DRAFT_1396951 [Hydnum rufescens UP504]
MPLKGTKLPRVPVDSATLSNSSHAKTGQPAIQHGGAVSSAESSVVLDGQDGFGGADKGSEPEIRTSKCQQRPTAKARPSNTVIAQAKQKTSAKVPSPVALSSISQHSPTPVPNSRSLTAICSPTLSATIPLVSFDASNKLALGIRPLSVTKWQTKKKDNILLSTHRQQQQQIKTGSLPPPVFSPHLHRTLTQKRKQDRIDTYAHSSTDATRPQTKKNRTDGETDSRSIDNSDEHMHTSPRSPQFGALSLLKSTMPQNDSMSHPHSSRPIPLGPMAIEEDTNGEVTVGLTHPSRPHILFEPTTDSDTDDRNDELTIGLDSTYHPPVNLSADWVCRQSRSYPVRI